MNENTEVTEIGEGTGDSPEASDAELNAAALKMAESLVTDESESTAKPPTEVAAPVVEAAPAPKAESEEALNARIEAYMQQRIADQRERSDATTKARAAEERATKAEERLARLRTDPLSVLTEEGMDFEALTALAVGGKTPAEVELRRINARLDADAKARTAETDRLKAEAAQREQSDTANRQVEAYKAEQLAPAIKAKAADSRALRAAVRAGLAEDGITVDAAKLELAVVDTVYHEMNRIFQARGQAPDVNEVLTKLEANAKKLKASLDAEFVTTPAPATKPKPKTLNNQLTTAAAEEIDEEDMSDEALNRRAIAFGRNLKSAAA